MNNNLKIKKVTPEYIVKDNRNYLIFAPSTEYSVDSSVSILVYSYDASSNLNGILKY